MIFCNVFGNDQRVLHKTASYSVRNGFDLQKMGSAPSAISSVSRVFLTEYSGGWVDGYGFYPFHLHFAHRKSIYKNG